MAWWRTVTSAPSPKCDALCSRCAGDLYVLSPSPAARAIMRASARSAAVFGRWLAWTGAVAALVVVVACVSLSGVFAIPALLAWGAATSVALRRSDERAD